jgi:predicted phosphodiesterase
MLIAIIADIHANLEALQTCLKKIDEIKPDKVICLGDLVDYCAQPNECVELVKERADANLLGNHDAAQFEYSIAEGFSEFAYVSSVHTRDVIKKEYVEYFKSLPYFYSFQDMLYVHGSPDKPEEFRYVLNATDAQASFSALNEKVCFIGHSHHPVIFEDSKAGVRMTDASLINSQNRYIINVGSVGQPRDGDHRLCFGLFDSDKFKFEHVRLDYPAEITSKKILQEGLPAFLGERLLMGV